MLKAKDGFVLVLMKSKEAVNYPRAFHIGFLQETKEVVDGIFESLGENPFLALRPPAKIRDTYGFYFHLDGIMIEVSSLESE